jgi:hypothetical protein
VTIQVSIPGHPEVKFTGVDIRWEEAEDKWSPAHYSVWPTFSGVDRERSSGWGTGKSRPLANRLAKAIRAGAAIADLEVLTDVNGKTYVGYRHVVGARHLNADLKRLGF